MPTVSPSLVQIGVAAAQQLITFWEYHKHAKLLRQSPAVADVAEHHLTAAAILLSTDWLQKHLTDALLQCSEAAPAQLHVKQFLHQLLGLNLCRTLAQLLVWLHTKWPDLPVALLQYFDLGSSISSEDFEGRVGTF